MTDEFYIDSAQLGAFRAFLDLHPEIKKIVGEIFQFCIVLDANMAIGDLLHKYKKPHIQKTALEECMQSSVIRVCAPRWLDTEMVQSTIPQVAKKQGIPEPALQALWATYRLQIEWSDKHAQPGAPINDQVDHKDIPYAAVQHECHADGILSHDRGIERAGGNRLTFQFVLSARTYARATVCSMTISVSGTIVTSFGVQALAELAKQVSGAVGRLPDGVKLLLLAAIAAALLHPTSRRVILENVAKINAVWSEVWPILAGLMNQAAESRKEAAIALADIHQQLGRSAPNDSLAMMHPPKEAATAQL
jgi:hypothetical protein